MQLNPAGPQLLMLLMVVVTVILGAWIVIRAIRRRPVGLFAAVLVGLFVLYTLALVGTGAASRATDLKPGDSRCFE
jgi:hypothetical protein